VTDDFMVLRVHKTSDRTVAQLLRGLLESEGVPAIVEGEHLSALEGQLPAGASAEYHVSIVDDEQLPRASLVLRRWLADQRPRRPAEGWTCDVCGEGHEAQFRSCWQCGSDRDAA
jgi:hypothetical protein